MSIQGLFIFFFVAMVVLATLNANRRSSATGRKTGIQVTRELLQATKGDRELAARLLNHAQMKYPGKSQHWYVDKVLYDLLRDGAGGASSAKDFRRHRFGKAQPLNPIQALWKRISNAVRQGFRGKGR